MAKRSSDRSVIVDQIRRLEPASDGRHGASAQYEVTLHLAAGESCPFVFEVEPGDIEVVRASDDFAMFLDHNLSVAEQLFAAVLAFHRARTFAIS